jgi:predicted MPP superfamily phosphohydrolase
VLIRSPTISSWLKAIITAASAAGLLAVGLAGFGLSVIRLAAYAIFLHGGIGMAASALILWRSRRKTAVAAAAVSVLIAVVAIDAFLVEPYWLELSRVRLESEKVERPVRLVVVADLQTDHFGSYEQDALHQVLEQKPDVILLAGDYFQESEARERELRRQTNEFLRAIEFSAPRGVFAVRGNVDSPGWDEAFEGLPIETVESTRSFDLGDLRVTCLGMRDSFDPRLKIEAPPTTQFHIVLGHAPNYALGEVEADLLVAGHTHGGQVRLPWIGPLKTLSHVPRSWAAGLTALPGGGKLLVSRGVGMERGGAPRLRFFCRPQLVVIDLVPKPAAD